MSFLVRPSCLLGKVGRGGGPHVEGGQVHLQMLWELKQASASYTILRGKVGCSK